MLAGPEILHYTGGDNDRGGVISVIRNLAAAGRFRCVLGVNPGCVQTRQPALPVLELPRIAGETINHSTLWRSRTVARAVQTWLQADATRVFHGHSRAGLLVGVWLARWGEARVVVSVHCYGRQRWFYRWAAGQLGDRLYWLSPAMKNITGWAMIRGRSASRVVCPGAGDDSGRRRVPDGKFVWLAGVGALVRWKRWDHILTALALLPATMRGRFRFSHIGTDDGSGDSQAYARELQETVSSAVEWCGQQGSSSALLAESDVLVIASHQEPFSVAMLEALRAGVPVLAASSGGAADVVRPGVNGWLFSSGDANDLAAKIAALGNPATWRNIAPEKIDLQRFAAENVAAQWLAVYQGRQELAL